LLGVGCGDSEEASGAESGCLGEVGGHGFYISQRVQEAGGD
jgi:hypothetical protein